ncbi:putative MFS family arabinose efflux permease [Sphingomonas sp. SORGH_AS 950]|uniref:MFS transporter n=1 Tax=Sphingomonas sp. SORGH_AS_0950 TaxID=3041792 RepID=UPI002781FD9B|nr:MFS transporter [Sphingomonas sp. SORGH_AS_0950]MDQ1159423.1 putative MFS family arabinose efflux permease [Sphingomonas sp. SORGH_AS_0950]
MTRSTPHRGYGVAVLMALVHMLAVGDRFLLSVLVEPIKAELHLGDDAIGFVQGPAFALVHGLAIVPMVLAARRWPLARLLALALLGSSVATILCGCAASVALLVPARMLMGLAQAAIGPAAVGLIAIAMEPGHRGRGIALFTAGASLGRGLAMIGGGALLALFAGLAPATGLAPWRLVLFAMGGVGLPLAWHVGRRPDPVARPGSAAIRMRQALRAMIADRASLVPHILSALCAALALQSLTSWSASLMIRQHGLTPPLAGAQVGLVMMVAGVLGHGLGGWLSDRLGRGRGTTPGLMLLGLGLCGLALWPLTWGGDWGGTLAALAVAVIGLSVTLANGLIGLQARIASALRVEATAIFLTVITLSGTALGPWLVGIASHALTGLADAVALVLGATCALGCGAALLAYRRAR